MKKYKIVIFEKAEDSIRRNFDYIVSSWENEPAAYEHTIDIYRAIRSLEVFPNSHQLYEQADGDRYRVVLARKYKIIFSVDDTTHTVYVADIIHSHQDPSALDLP